MSGSLQQLAEDLCRAFCGWKLQHDKRILTRLGSGTLEVDLLKRTCRFEREYIPRLVIVDELIRQVRLYHEDDDVGAEALRSATMSVKMTIEEREEQKDKSVMWFGEHDGFVGCTMKIFCAIATESANCKAEHRGYVEWPRKVRIGLKP